MQKKITTTQKLHYLFDKIMSKGTLTHIGGLFLLTLVFFVGLAVLGILAGSVGAALGEDVSFPGLLWQTILHGLDGGVISDQHGNFTYITIMLTATIGGMLFLSVLISLLNNGVSKKIFELQKGHSRVVEENHTVILGWSSQIFYIISELITASEGNKSCIAILADMDKLEMEYQIKMRIPNSGKVTIVCRSGNPIDLTDIEIINPHNAKSIIILSPDYSNDPDSEMIKMILAITNHPNRRIEKYHIVAEIREYSNVDVAKLVGKNEVSFILMEDVVAKIIAQTCRQPGLSIVVSELLDFQRNKIFFVDEHLLIGKQFGRSLLAYEHATPIGIMYNNGEIEINPTHDKKIERGDKLIVLSENNTFLTLQQHQEMPIDVSAILSQHHTPKQPERMLMLGWNRQAPTILTELDNYVVAGSTITIVSDDASAEHTLQQYCSNLKNLRYSFRRAETSKRDVLESLHCETFYHIIIMSYGKPLTVQEADARTIFTLLHLRDIAEKHKFPFTIVSQMLDIQNRELVNLTRVDDFVVSDKLNSLMLSQVSEEKYLARVYEDLFRAEGSELYVKYASEYVELRKPISFYTVVEAARRRNEIAIGYRLLSKFEEEALEFGVNVNPDKSKIITFFEDDKIIVLAESDI